MTRWPDLDGDPNWNDKLSRRYGVLVKRIHTRMKRYRGKNREPFVAELSQLKADYSSEANRLEQVMKSGSYIVAKTTRKGRRSGATMESTAESIGTALGQVAARLEAWRNDRAAIAADIQALARSAQGMLNDLGHSAESAVARVTGNKGGRPKGYRMSAATKAKLRAAWKRRS